jgi:hypothetical protein
MQKRKVIALPLKAVFKFPKSAGALKSAYLTLNYNPLYLIKADSITCPVIQLGCSR